MTTKSWRPEFLVGGEWCSNAQRFATEEEARNSAHDRFMVWTMPSDFRAAPSEDAVNYRWTRERGSEFIKEAV